MSVVKFEKSPLTEVVFGVEFNTTEFSSVDFGLYWQTIKERFPHQPLDRPPIGEVEIISILPKLRRVWFQSDDKKGLIQLQSNRFHYNWRRQNEFDEYPHFQKIHPIFEKEWKCFQQWWLNTKKSIIPLQPIRYELSYVNQIDQNFGWSNSSDNNKIFTFIGKDWNGYLQNPKGFNAQLEFDILEGIGVCSVNVNQVSKVEDNTQVLIFDLTTRSNDTKLETQEWFESAHEFTVRVFLDLIQNEIKNEWGLKWLSQK